MGVPNPAWFHARATAAARQAAIAALPEGVDRAEASEAFERQQRVRRDLVERERVRRARRAAEERAGLAGRR